MICNLLIWLSLLVGTGDGVILGKVPHRGAVSSFTEPRVVWLVLLVYEVDGTIIVVPIQVTAKVP